ncbi:hypothetical protein F4678DRAFT_465177 [Xylaria arbuscula]|nr:hypothetical protein F4678DRAFT_465177 [Xylaria arbuscula]
MDHERDIHSLGEDSGNSNEMLSSNYLDEERYNPNAIETEIDRVDLSRNKPDRCRCRSQSNRCRNCGCSKAGIGCNQSCGCGDTCDNRLTHLNIDDLFGKSEDEEPHSLHPCFVTFVQNMPDATFRRLTRENLFLCLEGRLSLPKLADYDTKIRDWARQWVSLEEIPFDFNTSLQLDERRVELQRMLLRMGLIGGRNLAPHFFSFCRQGGFQSTTREALKAEAELLPDMRGSWEQDVRFKGSYD